MQTTGNTILITGGGSGIGLRMAEEFLKLGNTVIVAGRSAARLETAAAPGPEDLDRRHDRPRQHQNFGPHGRSKSFRRSTWSSHGRHHEERAAAQGRQRGRAERNRFDEFPGTHALDRRAVAASARQNQRRDHDGLLGTGVRAAVDDATYSATKAAIHSYTQSLRYQLRDTQIQVRKLVPPYVQTH